MKDPQRNIHFSWKDLNIGIELKIFGIVFHLTDCDSFTKVISIHYEKAYKTFEIYVSPGIPPSQWNRVE